MPVNKGCVDVDQDAAMGMYGIVPCMITVYKHAYVYWLDQGLWGIGWNGFFDTTIELFSFYDWELVIVNIKI